MTNNCYEPMDIDSSANSCIAMDISYNCNDIVFEEGVQTLETDFDSTIEERKMTSFVSDNEHIETVKKFDKDMAPLKTKRNSFVYNHVYRILFFAMIIISVFSLTVMNSKCIPKIDFSQLNNTLTSKVFGQTEAVEAIVQSLEINATSKILLLYGGTGVGKTLSISILLENLLNYINIYHYTMPSFVEKFTMDLNLGFYLCDQWMIIVDDVTAKHNEIVPIVSEIIRKTESFKKNVTIVLIYNYNDVSSSFIGKSDHSFRTELQQVFKDLITVKKFIMFKPLTEEILRKCIEMELKHKLNRNMDIGKIMKYFDVVQDGCKGVYKKIQALS